MEIKLKIKDNLFVEGGHTIISYDTAVAKIEDRKIVEIGKFSRTTTKHISQVATMLGYPVQSNKEKKGFWRFEYGVKTNQGAFTLSPKLSHEIVGNLKSGMTWFQALVLCHPTKKDDRETLEFYFKKIGYDLKALQDSRDLGIVFA
jgi:hypothetical protein